MTRWDDKEEKVKTGWIVYKPLDKLLVGSVFITGLATIFYYVGLGVAKILEWFLK
jgi:hypothetical protein